MFWEHTPHLLLWISLKFCSNIVCHIPWTVNDLYIHLLQTTLFICVSQKLCVCENCKAAHMWKLHVCANCDYLSEFLHAAGSYMWQHWRWVGKSLGSMNKSSSFIRNYRNSIWIPWLASEVWHHKSLCLCWWIPPLP
jgi:hypothetical protein